jgi:hypothetical protein
MSSISNLKNYDQIRKPGIEEIKKFLVSSIPGFLIKNRAHPI